MRIAFNIHSVKPLNNRLPSNQYFSETIKQTLEIVSGDREEYDFGRMTVDISVRFGTSLLKVPGKYTLFSDVNRMIDNLPTNISRGYVKYLREDVIPDLQKNALRNLTHRIPYNGHTK